MAPISRRAPRRSLCSFASAAFRAGWPTPSITTLCAANGANGLIAAAASTECAGAACTKDDAVKCCKAAEKKEVEDQQKTLAGVGATGADWALFVAAVSSAVAGVAATF